MQLRRGRADEHVAGEQVVPGLLGDHPHLQPVRGVGAGIEVLGEQLAAGNMVDGAAQQPGEPPRLKGWLVVPQSISSCSSG